ncbi:hypothetical protein [Agromyces salentinus]|uniref:Chemotaxis protein n=1 Tax=Agromyces salentinus TaxID=269421 RepID=A0ABN2MKJ0_9MICO|nr:hypothetical protein [Agromyces salentinus]
MTDPMNSQPFTPDPDATDLDGEYTDTDFGDDTELGGDADLAERASRAGADTGLGTGVEGEYTDTDFGADSALGSDDDLDDDDDELRDLDRSNDQPAGGDRPDGVGPGAPGNAQPMTESTDGGLRGGDPGVEE